MHALVEPLSDEAYSTSPKFWENRWRGMLRSVEKNHLHSTD